MKKIKKSTSKVIDALIEASKANDGIITFDDIENLISKDNDDYDIVIKALGEKEVVIAKTNDIDISVEIEDEEVDNIDALILSQDDEDENEEDDFKMAFQSLESTLKTDDPVRMYLREIGNIPLLTNAEELSVAQRIQAGKDAILELDELDLVDPLNNDRITVLEEVIEDGKTAKDILVESNLRLVVSIAKKHVNKGLQFLDLIQEGNMGLMKATEKFDCSKGFKFSTYATWWIRQAITRAIADQGRIVRIPVHMVEQINKVVRFSRKFTQENRREPSLEEISEALDITIEKIKTIKKISQDPVSLESPVGEEEDSTLGDFIPDNSSLNPDEYTNKEMLKVELDKVLATLTDREERVIRMRYGLDDGRTHTLEEVGEVFGVTRERIRQIEFKAIRKIKQPTKSKKLLEYLND